MKIEEAYPDDKGTLTDVENARVEQSYPSVQNWSPEDWDDSKLNTARDRTGNVQLSISPGWKDRTIAKSHPQCGVGDRKVGAYSSRKNEAPGDDITRSKTSPSIIPQCKVKKKRQLRNTLQSSADDRPNMKKKRHKEKHSSNMSTWFRKQDGSIDHTRILRLNLKELRKLAEDFKLKMPKDFKKHQIRDQIISLLISSSSEWKLWSKATKNVCDDDLSETTDDKTQCSSANTPHDLPLPDQYPVKGVRAMKTRDAYPEDKRALGVKKNVG